MEGQHRRILQNLRNIDELKNRRDRLKFERLWKELLQEIRAQQAPAPAVPQPPANTMNERITISNKTLSDIIVLFTSCSLHATDPPVPIWHVVTAFTEPTFRFKRHVNGMYVTALWDRDVVQIANGKYDVFVPFGTRLAVEQHAA